MIYKGEPLAMFSDQLYFGVESDLERILRREHVRQIQIPLAPATQLFLFLIETLIHSQIIESSSKTGLLVEKTKFIDSIAQ